MRPASRFRFDEIEAKVEPNHVVANGYDADILIRWGDPVLPGALPFDPRAQTADAQSKQFGYNNDFLGYFPMPGAANPSAHGLLVVNHEYHQRGTDVSRDRPAGSAQRRLCKHDAGAGRDRDGGAWRRGDRGPPRGRKMVSRAELEIRAPHRRYDTNGHHGSCRRSCPHANQGRPYRQARSRHAEQLRRRRHAVGHLAHLRGKFPASTSSASSTSSTRRQSNHKRYGVPGNWRPGANTPIGSRWRRSRTSPIASAGSSRSIRSIPPRRRRNAPRSGA